MNNINAERFALENGLDVSEVIDFFRGFDFQIGVAEQDPDE